MTTLGHTAAVMAGEAGPTICKLCKHLQLPHKDAREWSWLCNASPKPLEFSYLTGEEAGAPFIECKRINTGGNCSLYHEGINDLSPDRLIPDGHGGWLRKPEESK